MNQDRKDRRKWIGFFDPDGAWYHVVLTEHPGHHWHLAVLDEAVSDPEGNFLVYVDHRTSQDVRVSIRCDSGPSGMPLALHEAFNTQVFGSPTLPWATMKESSWSTSSPWKGERPSAWQGVPIPRFYQLDTDLH